MGKGNMHAKHDHYHRVLKKLQPKCGSIVIVINSIPRFLNYLSFCCRENALPSVWQKELKKSFWQGSKI